MTGALSVGTVSPRMVSNGLPTDPLITANGAASASPLTTSADPVPKIVAPPGTFAAPVSETEKTTAMPATIVSAGTPGDQIIAGLNKRWAQFARSINSAESPASSVDEESDTRLSPAGSGQPWSTERPSTSSTGRWSSTLDEVDERAAIDQDAMIDGMSDRSGFVDTAAVEASIKQMKAMDQGGALAAELSAVARDIETSVKTLVTGQ